MEKHAVRALLAISADRTKCCGGPWVCDMRRIIQANIDRLKELLKTETDPTKRAMKARLLAEEELKQKHLPTYDKKETKAY